MKENKRIKKWGFLISLFILFLISPLKVSAIDTLTLLGDSSVSPGTTIKYDVNLNLTDKTTTITGLKTDVYYDSSIFTLTNVEAGLGWSCDSKGTVASGGDIECSSELGVVGQATVMSLVFKVNSSITTNSAYVTLKTASYTSKDATGGEEMHQLEEVTNKLNIKSSDNTLKSLKINGKAIDGFTPDVFEYDLKVEADIEIANVIATPNSNKATLKLESGNRSVELNYGSNVINVVVVSESGLEQTYTVNITREDTRSTDTTLSSITIDGVSISNFKSSTYKYTVKKYKTQGVTIVGVPTDKKATVVVTPPVKIVTGENVYILTVTSEKGDSAIYTVVINNIDTTINKKLKNLSIKGYNIDFDKNNNRYEINYNKQKFKDLHIYFTTMANSDEVTAVLSPDINNDSDALSNLKPGDEITITVTGIDDETVEYTIVIAKDNRVSFFLVLELLIMAIIVIIIIVIAKNRKNKNKKNNSDSKSVKKKDNSSKIEKTTTKKKKRFSIYEEDEIDEDDEFSATKELTEEELNLK